MFARANPVPSLDVLDPIEVVDIDHLAVESERSSTMSEIRTVESKVEPRRRRPTAIVVGACALLVVIIGVVIGLTNRQAEVAATPVENAEAFLEARNRHDAKAMSALLAEDAIFVPGEELVMNEDNLQAATEFEEIVGWEHTVVLCFKEPSFEGPPTRVRCTYTMENDLGRAVGLEPRAGTHVIFDIEEGRIVRVENAADSNYISGSIGAFLEWWGINHPETEPQGTANEVFRGIVEPESLALWRQYVPEFLAEMEASG
jgi:hypothetical protein